jgi:hypothetical protein
MTALYHYWQATLIDGEEGLISTFFPFLIKCLQKGALTLRQMLVDARRKVGRI